MVFAWPRHVHERRGPNWHEDVPLVGSGPFVLTERLAPTDSNAGRLTLRFSPTWLGSRGNVAEVTVEQEPSASNAGNRWRSGEYELFYEGLAGPAGLIPDDQTVVELTPGGYTEYLGLNATRPPLDDPRIRRALAHAIDREGTSARVAVTPARTGGLLPPAMPGHSPRVAPAFDRGRARAVLSDAGYPGGHGLDELVLACLDLHEAAAFDVAAQLAAVGFRVQCVAAESTRKLAAAIDEGALNAYLWAWGYTLLDPGAGFLEPLLAGYPILYRDAQLEELLARSIHARDQDERLRACREFERIWIGEHAAVVPLTYEDPALWRRPWLTGMWANTLARATFADAVVRPEMRAAPKTV
jgi:oligopeptide transport system substrate-binding protein